MNPAVIQCNASFNARSDTLRGMHYQADPHGESKLVRCVRGAIFDVAVDLRPDSPTFCRWHGVELSAGNGRAFYIPAGFAHGFQTLADDCEVLYQMGHALRPRRRARRALGRPRVRDRVAARRAASGSSPSATAPTLPSPRPADAGPTIAAMTSAPTTRAEAGGAQPETDLLDTPAAGTAAIRGGVLRMAAYVGRHRHGRRLRSAALPSSRRRRHRALLARRLPGRDRRGRVRPRPDDHRRARVLDPHGPRARVARTQPARLPTGPDRRRRARDRRLRSDRGLRFGHDVGRRAGGGGPRFPERAVDPRHSPHQRAQARLGCEL